MAAPVFREADRDNLELVRQVVLSRLKNDPGFQQFDRMWSGDHVTYEVPQLRYRFTELANEVLWGFIIQGVISPGLDASNPTLPWFHLTGYGRSVLAAERFIPHDPTGYLVGVRQAATTTVTQVALAYVEEALRCFNAGCHVAAVLLLGVAGEAIFERLCEVIAVRLASAEAQRQFEALPPTVKARHRWILERYQQLPAKVRREDLPESLDMTLTSLYDLIRRQRNELGHPQSTPPSVGREQAFVFFRLFPTWVADIEALANYCIANRF
jgi:hypothetical protein